MPSSVPHLHLHPSTQWRRNLSALLTAFLIFASATLFGATVATDMEDYSPGVTALISGSGFAPGETVRLQVLHADGTPSTGSEHDPWTVIANTSGTISSTWFVCTDDCVMSVLELTAVGLSSAVVAKSRFTDGSTGILRLMNVTASNGGCVSGPTGSGTQHWDVEAGQTYTLTFSFPNRNSFDACLGSSLPNSISLTLQGFAVPFTATRTGNSSTYTGTVTIPGTACRTTPIRYCGGFVRRADGNSHQAHLRVSTFGATCTNPVEKQCCSDKPFVICPANIATNSSPDRCDALVTFVAIPATGCPAVVATVVCVPPSGSLFGIGVTTVTCTARDGAGQSASCIFLVTVTNRQPPTIFCGADKVIECPATPSFDPPTSVDHCSNLTVRIVSTVTNTAGFCGNTRSITRTWEALNGAGLSARCSQTITVVDATPPTITCSPDRVAECGAVMVFTRPTAFDSCDGTNVVIAVLSTITNASCGNGFSATRTWTATDRCGNQSRCSQSLIAVDTTPPVIACAPDRITECGTPCDFTRPTAADLCDGTNVNIRIVGTTTNRLCGNTFAAIRTWAATDRCGNESRCSQTLNIVDTTSPAISCGPDRTTECGTPCDFTRPVAIDLCDGTNVVISIVGTVTNALCGNSFSATRTWAATDRCGNQSRCTQTISIIDTTPPGIICGPDLTAECGSPWNFTRPTALDACDGTNVTIRIISTITNGLCGNTFFAIRTWTATDNCGNQSRCSQRVTVLDTLPPILVGVPPNAHFNDPAAMPPPSTVTAFDNCDSIVVVTHTSLTNTTCPIVIVRCWTAMDLCGNSVTACQTNVVECRPRICVTKDVACLLQGDQCGAFGNSATGVKSDTQNPAFCYRITVSNCGRIPLRNITVVDDRLGDLTPQFFSGIPADLAAGASITRFFKMAWGSDTLNTVISGGASATDGSVVYSTNSAFAHVVTASIVCQEIVTSSDDIDGNPFDNHVQLPRDGQLHAVNFLVIVSNTGDADLANVRVASLVASCSSGTAPFSLRAGAAITNSLCILALSCDQEAVTDTVSITATTDSTRGACAFDITGIPVTARSQCGASVDCRVGACRVTGGGRQEHDETFPSARYTTHGGQVGAPVGNATAFDPDSSCIRGSWEHVRHVRGNANGNFHSHSFDSLMCACLACPGDAGSGVVIGDLCNPGDRICGPEPRRAPANKICFSGVGDYSMSSGARQARSVLFRVDIEDHSEPGNSSKPSEDPPDRYRIRIWILTPAELAQLGNSSDRLLNFRRAIACSAGSTSAQDGAPGALGSAVFGVRAPDIDDGGALDHGNHQIHPMIKACP
ncbi:MAG: hypothetical protein QOF48_1168 [Verrucomicrobiota bacterium]